MKKTSANKFVLIYTFILLAAILLHIFVLLSLKSETSIYLKTPDKALFSKLAGIAPGEINLKNAEKFGIIKIKIVLVCFVSALIGRFCFEDKKYIAWKIFSLIAVLVNLLLVIGYVWFLITTKNIAFITCFSLTVYTIILIYSIKNFIQFFG